MKKKDDDDEKHKHNFAVEKDGTLIKAMKGRAVKSKVDELIKHQDSEILLMVVRLNDEIGIASNGPPREEMLAMLKELVANYELAIRATGKPH